MLRANREAIKEAVCRVIDSGQFVLGDELAAFEQELSSYLGVGRVVGVSSGTDALALALRALEIGPGDEVLVPAVSFIATAEAVVTVGATPVFTDIDPETWTMTAETAQQQIGPKVKALIPVHLFGNPAPVHELRSFGLPIIEDACQSIGSSLLGLPTGTLGDIAAFSFYPSKVLPCVGDGGAVTTNDPELAERVRLLRHHGSPDNRDHLIVGGTHRLDEIQAAALRSLLPLLPAEIERRQQIAARSTELISSSGALATQRITEGATSSFSQIALRLLSRDLLPDLPEGTRTLYSAGCHEQRSMWPYWRGPLPEAESFVRNHFALRTV